jgi:predicted secreted hydrolase
MDRKSPAVLQSNRSYSFPSLGPKESRTYKEIFFQDMKGTISFDSTIETRRTVELDTPTVSRSCLRGKPDLTLNLLHI